MTPFVRCLTVLGGGLLLSCPVAAEPEAPGAPPDPQKPAPAAEAPASTSETSTESGPREPKDTAAAEAPANSSEATGTDAEQAEQAVEKPAASDTGDEPPGAPPPGPPRADEQLPAPVPAEPPTSRSRHVLLGMYFGPFYRSSEEERVSYGTSLAWGPYVGIEIMPWLRVAGYARFEKIPVNAKPGAFDTETDQYPDTSIEQESLDSSGLGIRAAPTWVLNDWLRLSAFADIMWSRFTASPPLTSGATQITSAERAGVGLNYKAGLGVNLEPVRDWLEISLSGSYGAFAGQSGDAFNNVLQGFDQTGNIVHLAPLPKFKRSLDLFLAVGVVL